MYTLFFGIKNQYSIQGFRFILEIVIFFKYNFVSNKFAMKTITYFGFALISMLFVGFGASFENLKNYEASAQSSSSSSSSNEENTRVLEQLVTNLTQAQNTVSNNNSELATTQLTAIIGELSDIIGKIATNNDGQYLDTHTHYINHHGHAHTVTHTHPHHADHHSHHESWTEKHHIFDPSHCKPGLMC